MHTYIVEEVKDAQNKVDDALDFLAKDEDEAITGYKQKIEEIKASGSEGMEVLLEQLAKIEKEEEEHKAFLLGAKADKQKKFIR